MCQALFFHTKTGNRNGRFSSGGLRCGGASVYLRARIGPIGRVAGQMHLEFFCPATLQAGTNQAMRWFVRSFYMPGLTKPDSAVFRPMFGISVFTFTGSRVGFFAL